MKRWKFTLSFTVVSAFYWLLESLIHRHVYSESFVLVPGDSNELWMRALIVILFISIGLLGDNRAAKIATAEKQKQEIYMATISSTQHVMNNLLNQLQLVFFEADKAHELSESSRKLLAQSIREGKEQIEKLSSVTQLSGKTIRESVEPK